jgi:hypothetical protein
MPRPDIPLPQRVKAVLDLIAEEHRPCLACGTEIWLVRHQSGRIAPYTADLVNHFINCPKAEQFQKRKKAREALLFDKSPLPG